MIHFRELRTELESERDASNSQLERQSCEMSSASHTLSQLTGFVQNLHKSLSEQSDCWQQVHFCSLLYHTLHTITD